jgi:hypothetical protein
MDPAAKMEVASVGDSAEEFDLVSVTVQGSVLSSFGRMNAETNVEHIAEICRKATGSASQAGGLS